MINFSVLFFFFSSRQFETGHITELSCSPHLSQLGIFDYKKQFLVLRVQVFREFALQSEGKLKNHHRLT